MFRKVVSGIMLTLLLVGIFSLAINVEPAKSTWTGTVYIRADGSIDPPDAPITTYDNITYTLTDNITSSADGIVVERDNIVIDGAGHMLQGTGEYGYKGIWLDGRSNVTIKNTTITKFYCGVSLSHSSNNTIVGNNITAIHTGIHMVFSSFNNVCKNIMINGNYGVNLFYSSNNNYINKNIFIENGLYVIDSYKNVVKNNTVNGKPLAYLEEAANQSIVNAGQVILVNSTNIRVENLNLSRTTVGIELLNTNNSVISGNNINGNFHGIRLISSLNCGIFRNNISDNADSGIILDGLLNNIFRNNISGNDMFGILLSGGGSNCIFRNNITANKESGIGLFESSNNMISVNDIIDNKCGIDIYGSSNNKIYHNNLVNNAKQVNIYTSLSANIWDDGYPSGGNYWSDYTGTDLFSGPYQNETGSDGIGDTPYIIDENNVDHYPLMNPYAITPPVPSVINASVNVNPKALNLRSRGRWITAYIELPEGYNIQDINASTIMLNDTISAEPKPIAVGDHDGDGILDLMVKFDRASVISYILANVNKTKLFEDRFMRVTLTITGYLNDGTPFQGTTTIRVLMPIPCFLLRHWRFCRTLQVFPI